jgi:hypothetical protein
MNEKIFFLKTRFGINKKLMLIRESEEKICKKLSGKSYEAEIFARCNRSNAALFRNKREGNRSKNVKNYFHQHVLEFNLQPSSSS